MGNATSFASCSRISDSVSVSTIRILKNKRKKIAILLDTSGNIREIKLPVKSGELMIEQIGHVITPVDDLRRTRRVSALGADEELVAGKVYLLVPVNRVHSKVSEFEMAVAEKFNESGRRRKSGTKAKVSPSQLEKEIVIVRDPIPIPISRNLARWNPVLDPIFES